MPFLRSRTRFQMSSCQLARLSGARFLKPAAVVFLFTACAWPQAAQLTTAEQGSGPLQTGPRREAGHRDRSIRDRTRRSGKHLNGRQGDLRLLREAYAKPFKTLFKLTRVDGTQITAGFDGKVSWTITPKGAEIDKDTALDAIRRDADLHYPLHQPDYFKKLGLAGISDFEGHRC